MRLQKWRRFAGKDRQPLDEPSARGDRISDQGGRDKVERMQQTKLIISPERADFWLLGPFLISSVSQSINHHHPACCKMVSENAVAGQRTGPSKLFGSGRTSPSGHGTRHMQWRMQPDATWHVCATSTHLEAARAGTQALPIVALAEERQRETGVESSSVGGGRRIFERTRMPMRREGICCTQYTK